MAVHTVNDNSSRDDVAAPDEDNQIYNLFEEKNDTKSHISYCRTLTVNLLIKLYETK